MLGAHCNAVSLVKRRVVLTAERTMTRVVHELRTPASGARSVIFRTCTGMVKITRRSNQDQITFAAIPNVSIRV